MKYLITLIILLTVTNLNARDWRRFTNNIELKSDSKIKIDKNFKLYSNAPIYGIYHSNHFLYTNLNNGVFNITCGTNKRIYKVRNECYMLINKQDNRYTSKLDLDKSDVLYLSKSNSNNMKSFNYKDHEIECKYSKENGIMHDCRVKINKYIFR